MRPALLVASGFVFLASGLLAAAAQEKSTVELVGGGLRIVGELKAGDQIYRWAGGEHQVATVRTVSLPGREAPVFNLVLGDSTTFVADGFFVRSKPPALAAPARAEGPTPQLPLARPPERITP